MRITYDGEGSKNAGQWRKDDDQPAYRPPQAESIETRFLREPTISPQMEAILSGPLLDGPQLNPWEDAPVGGSTSGAPKGPRPQPKPRMVAEELPLPANYRPMRIINEPAPVGAVLPAEPDLFTELSEASTGE